MSMWDLVNGAGDAASWFGGVVSDMVDTDKDGAVIDDALSWGVKGLATAGGAVAGGAAGAALGGPETFMLGAVPAAAAGAGIGSGVGYMIGSAGGAIAEEAGDFMSDALGTRGAMPYGGKAVSDPYYKYREEGEQSVGERLNSWWAG